MTQAEDDRLLSDRFRTYCSSLPDFSRKNLQSAMLGVFSASTLRNVQLWTEDRSTTRNFINRQIDPDERALRETWARAVLASSPPSRPQKSIDVEAGSLAGNARLQRLMADPWINGKNDYGAIISYIRINGDGSITLWHDSDSNNTGGGNVLSPEDPEFDDIFETINE